MYKVIGGSSQGRKLTDGRLCTKKTQVETLAHEEETEMAIKCVALHLFICQNS